MASDSDPHDQIVRLEDEIEELALALKKCRWFIMLSQVAMVGGGIWLLALLLKATEFAPAAMLCSIAAIIGGIVGFGSNTSTARQLTAAMLTAEKRRAELIGSIDLPVVGEEELRILP
jgi:hypothetical protein